MAEGRTAVTRLRAISDSVRATYWAVPSAMALAAVLLSIAVIQIDEAMTAELLNKWAWGYTGGPEGARAVLSTIASSMITVAGVAFSITIVALTLASQQFGPRLLRNFLRDLGNQVVLGTFISTFIYCLLVLRTVRGNDDSPFVPHLAVTLGVVLAMVSLGVLIFFIHHIATSIQASQVIANVAADLDAAIDHLFPERIGQGPVEGEAEGGSDAPLAPLSDRDATPVTAARSGYVQAIDTDRLMTTACDCDLLIRVTAKPGTFVRPGSPLGSVWFRGTAAEDVAGALRSAFIMGVDRTGTQDVGFFINQLVEVAVRALSPAVNDPATARTCIDRLEQALARIAGRAIPSPRRYDDEGVLRVVADPTSFAGMVDLAFDEIERYGRSSVSVTCGLLDAIQNLAPAVMAHEDRAALLRHARRIGRGEAFTAASDRLQVESGYRAALEALAPTPEGWVGRDPAARAPANRRG